MRLQLQRAALALGSRLARSRSRGSSVSDPSPRPGAMPLTLAEEVEEQAARTERARAAFLGLGLGSGEILELNSFYLLLMRLGCFEGMDVTVSHTAAAEEWRLAVPSATATKIDLDQFLAYYRERLELQRQDEEQAQRARTAFDACDGNRDGLLKQEEFCDCLRAMGVIEALNPTAESAVLREQFLAADADGDGRVNYSDFLRFCGTLSARLPDGDSPARELWSRLSEQGVAGMVDAAAFWDALAEFPLFKRRSLSGEAVREAVAAEFYLAGLRSRGALDEAEFARLVKIIERYAVRMHAPPDSVLQLPAAKQGDGAKKADTPRRCCA